MKTSKSNLKNSAKKKVKESWKDAYVFHVQVMNMASTALELTSLSGKGRKETENHLAFSGSILTINNFECVNQQNFAQEIITSFYIFVCEFSL